MAIKRIILISCILLIVPVTALTNELREFTFSQKVKQADAIVVGRVLQLNDVDPPNTYGRQYATIKVRGVIKGKVETTIKLWTKKQVAESNPNCCVVGDDYVIYLERLSDGSYNALDGHFGVIEMSNP